MEEDRIGAMYWNLVKRNLGGVWESLFPRGLRRSSWLPIFVIAVLILGPAIAYRMHRRGRFATLKTQIKQEVGNVTPAYGDPHRPGGVLPLILTRATAGAAKPEFLSATLLPGLGMGVLQITANLPGKGATPLLEAPSVEAVAQGNVVAASGANDNHGSFELPWAGSLSGAQTPMETSVTAQWRGKSADQSTQSSGVPGSALAMLLEMQPADQMSQTDIPGGKQAEAFFKAVNSDGRWFSQTDVHVTTQMTAQAIEILLTAKNTGDQPEPLGIGWHPRFAVVSGLRNHIELRLPAGQLVELADAGRDTPSGRLVALPPGLERFTGKPSLLESAGLNATITGLNYAGSASGASGNGPAASGPAVEMRDEDAGYGLRMTALSQSIRAVRVTSPVDAAYVSLGMSTNLDDPLGKQWPNPEAAGMKVLEPGETMEWKVRLEIFPLGANAAPAGHASGHGKGR